MKDYFKHLCDNERGRLKECAQPEWTAPMLARLTDERFSDPNWIYERKFDGERVLCFRKGNRVRLMSRNRKSIGGTYPELVDALSHQPCDDFVVDGEIVAFENGVTSFSRLQQRMQINDPQEARSSRVAVYCYLFDLLHLEGYGLERLALRVRKAVLRHAISFEDPLRYTPHRNRDGEAYYEEACEKGWEGVIAKRAESEYRHSRSADWLKFKCAKGQELVIGGFTEPQGSRAGFGALLVGYYENGKLRYAGKVGTGYSNEFLASFRKRLDGLARQTSPFSDQVKERGVTWVAPELVGEIGFTEWTEDGKLRHPRFMGVRRDKEPKEVVRETADSQ